MTPSLRAAPLLLAVLLGCDASPPGADGDAFRPVVHVEPARVVDVERTLTLSGTVEAGRTVWQSPAAPGEVAEVLVHTGDTVTEGQILVKMDLDIARLQLQQADAAVRMAELGLSTAESEARRAEALFASGSLTEQQIEQARTGHDMAEAQLLQAKATQGLAREQVADGVLRAPFDGLIAGVSADPGQAYSAMAMNPAALPGLVGVVDLDTVRLDVQVSDRDVVHLEPGMPVHLTVDVLGEAGRLDGRVEWVGVAADSASRTFPVRIVADNPEHRIRSGMHARVDLVVAREEGAVAVPEDQVHASDSGPYVVVAQDGVASRREVHLGLYGDDLVAVHKGLESGDLVVTDGAFGLPSGAAVEVIR